jgi:hypothetical protein
MGAKIPERSLRPLARAQARTSYPYHQLNDAEEAALWKFMDSRKVREIMKGEGAALALVFTAGGGIGICTTAKVRNNSGAEAEADITDVSVW